MRWFFFINLGNELSADFAIIFDGAAEGNEEQLQQNPSQKSGDGSE